MRRRREGGSQLQSAANQVAFNADQPLDGAATPATLESQALLGENMPATVTYLSREYVWGPGDWGVDELLAQYDEGRRASWPLQDAGGDVIALCDLGGTSGTARVITQIVYDAYGRVIGRDDPATPSTGPPELRVGHKGLFFDRLDGGIADPLTGFDLPRLWPGARLSGHVRNRTLHCDFGRWNQPDPNATGLPVQASLSYHGGGLSAGVQGFELQRHFGDGPNYYAYLGEEPMGRTDPVGLFFGMAGAAVSAGLNAWDFASSGLDTAEIGLRAGFGLASMISDYMTMQEADLEWASDWAMHDADNYAGDIAGEAFGVSFGDYDITHDADTAMARRHANSLSSRAKNHGYQIDYFNPKTKKWEVWKYGISSQGVNKSGLSKRALYQKNAFGRNPGHRAHGKKFRLSANELRQFTSRRQGLRWEEEMVRINGRPPGMRRPRRKSKPAGSHPKMPVQPRSKYWVGISRIETGVDERRDPAVFGAEPIISRKLISSRVLHGTQWKGMTFVLNYCPEGVKPARYRCVANKRHGLLHFEISVCDKLLRLCSIKEYRDDVVRSFLTAIDDALSKRGIDTAKLKLEIKALPRPKRSTAFVNLLGDVCNERSKNSDLSGVEVVLVVPFVGMMPTPEELKQIQKLDVVIDRAMRRADAGSMNTREVGNGTAEYMIGCDRAAPTVAVLRDLFKRGLLPDNPRVFVRNLNTGREHSASLRRKVRNGG